MAESAVAFLLKELSTFLLSQSSVLGEGLQREVRFIRDELGSMRAFLRDAEAKENDVSELQEWIRQVREVAYDTEDILDEFLMKLARHRADGLSGRVRKIYCSIKDIKARHQISSKIKDIKLRIEDISARHQRYQPIHGISERGSCSTVGRNVESHIRGNALLLEEAKLVGITKPKGELISPILDENSNLKVVSVLGMGGLGKTTLVKRVYEDPSVKRRFQSHAWLTVSQTFRMELILKDLIRQLYNEYQEQVRQYVEAMDGDQLRAFVKNLLQGRSYIIVLDDIWRLDSWEAIKYAFPDASCGSRIMLTTRIADAAFGSCTQSHDYVHKMMPLSREESWALFCIKTFGGNCCPSHLEDVSRRILGKCDGLPLSIVSIGGVLASKEKSKFDEWEIILRGLGGELGTGKLEKLKKILFLSFNDLPFFLKNCLLYTSIYPEDSKINVHVLIQRWIVEGFIEENKGMAMVEVSMGYFNELVGRSLIQVEDGDKAYCRVHDILLEIICSKSREQNFTAVATMRDYTNFPNNIRRLAVHGFTNDHIEACNNFKHLRSLGFFGYINPLNDSSLSQLLSGGPKLLKVLDLGGADLKSIPEEVLKLFRLKHLNIMNTGIDIIPESIGKLRNLEYLNLGNTTVMELPVSILKLRKLRELLVYHKGNYSENYRFSGFKAPRDIGRLSSLETLDSIVAENDEVVRDFGRFIQLRIL